MVLLSWNLHNRTQTTLSADVRRARGQDAIEETRDLGRQLTPVARGG
jgi:hypothetical protein